MDILNKLNRNVNEMTEQNKLIEQENINFRTFALRRDPFDDIEKPTPSPITKSCKPQGLAAGQQAGIKIIKNDLKNSKDSIEILKKELDNTELLSQRYY